MTHGVASTKGHLASNGGLRAHSVDDVFPWIVMQKGDRIGVLTPSGWFRGTATNTWKAAGALARVLNQDNIKSPDTDVTTRHQRGHTYWEYIGSK